MNETSTITVLSTALSEEDEDVHKKPPNPSIDKFELIPIVWTWWLICQLVLALVGLFGNFVVIVIYTRKNRLKSATNMFIMALAFADMISSITLIPLPGAKTVPAGFVGQLYCKVVHSNVILWISIVASIFTLTVISVERYFAVVFPIKYRNFFSKSRPKIVILIVWVSSFLINTFSYFVTYRNNESGSCVVDFRTPFLQALIGSALFILEYFIPVVIMISTQLITINRLRQQAKPIGGGAGNGGPGNKERENAFMLKARRKVIRMLFLVILTFITCWTPDQVAFLVFNLGYVEPQYLGGNLYRMFIALAFTNSCANPFIYTVSNPQFREALRQLLHVKKNRIFPFTIGRGSGNTENTSADAPPPTGVDALEAQGGAID